MDPSPDLLDSWKDIAGHFRRTVRTVQRWERSCDLPIHRHGHQLSSTVYAYRSELDAWWLGRKDPEPAAREDPSPSPTKQWSATVSAQDLCLMARDEWNGRTVDGIRRSAALARQAIQRDPGHGRAHAMLVH